MTACCPYCDGTSGISYNVVLTGVRIASWSGEVLETELNLKHQSKAGYCIDCLRRVYRNVKPVTVRSVASVKPSPRPFSI